MRCGCAFKGTRRFCEAQYSSLRVSDVRRVELVRKLGDGSAVESFLGHDGESHYFVQISRPEMSDVCDVMGRFLDLSADFAAQKHPELLTIDSLTVTPEGRFFLQSDAITGWTAADLLRRSGTVPEEVVVEWGVALCEALSVIHARGQTHGCLAPRHLHLKGASTCPSMRLADTTFLHFRSAFALSSDVVVVEPQYLSPERAAGTRGSASSDIWGMGALLVELLTGRAPFLGRTREESLALVGHARPPRLSARWERWNEVMAGTLDPVAANRFNSALEVRQALLHLV